MANLGEGGEIEDENDEDSTLATSLSLSASSLVNSSTPPISQIALTALQFFRVGQYAKCLEHLRKLQGTLELLGSEDELRVSHNIAVVNYYMSGCKEPNKFLEALAKIIDARRQRTAKAKGDEEGDSTDDLEGVDIAQFNQAVIYYQLKQYSVSVSILEQLYASADSINDNLIIHICFLLLDAYHVLGQSEKAANVLSYLDKVLQNITKKESERRSKGGWDDSNGKQDDGESDTRRDSETEGFDVLSANEVKALIHLNKAKFSLLNKSLKTAKRDIKFAMGSAQSPPAIVVKANMEYQQNNYAKSVKLLDALQKCSTTDRTLPILYYNDLGCIHHKLKKNNVALFYFNKALKENESLSNDPKNQFNLPTFSRDRRAEVMYNNGLMLLLSGNPEPAFAALKEASSTFYKNPRLWLRLGEACVGSHLKKMHNETLKQKNDVVTAVVGSGRTRRIILKTPKIDLKDENTTESDDKPSLEYAVECFKNVIYLYRTSPPDASSDETQLLQVLQAALVNLTYVYLSLDNPSTALSTANELLALKSLTPHYSYLGHVYAAEALCMLDRPSEAAKHLGPNVLSADPSDPSYFANIPSPYSLCSTQGTWNPSSPLAKAILLANLATVHILQDDLVQAQQQLAQALAAHPPAASQAPFLLLSVYLELRKGNTETALEFLKRGSFVPKASATLTAALNSATSAAGIAVSGAPTPTFPPGVIVSPQSPSSPLVPLLSTATASATTPVSASTIPTSSSGPAGGKPNQAPTKPK